MSLPVSPTGEAVEVFERTPGCITVAVSAWPPLVDIRQTPFIGTHVSTFRLVMERLKWCYYLAATPDQQWGDKLNGTWTGMVGMIDRKQADIALGPLGVTLLRTEVVDFAMPLMNSDNNFLYKAVTTVQPDVLIFTKSFDVTVWEYILGTVFVVGICAALLHSGYTWVRKHKFTSRAELMKAKRDTGPQALMWSLRMFLTQDPQWIPLGDSGRVIAIIWMLMCSVISLMYRCNLKAILITTEVRPPFDSMDELVEQTEYKWTIVDGTYYGGYFKIAHGKAPDTVRGRMWPLRADPIKSAVDIVPAALASKVGVLAPRVFHLGSLADDFSEVGECRIAFTKRGFHDIYLTFAYPKKSILREPVDMMILRVLQAGLPDQISDYQLRNASWCVNPKKNQNESRAFTIGDYMGIFIFYLIGNAIALVILCFEMITFKVNEERSETLEIRKVQHLAIVAPPLSSAPQLRHRHPQTESQMEPANS